jgi:hypothetical protein
LRFSDQLYNLLILKLIKIDKNDGVDINLRPNLKKFMEFLKVNCKISNPYYTSMKADEKIKFRSLNGNERMTIFREIFRKYPDFSETTLMTSWRTKNFDDIFPENSDPMGGNFQFENNLWYGFYKVCLQIRIFDKNWNSTDDIDRNLKDLLDFYIFINKYNRNSNTIFPYAHIAFFHLTEMLELHKNLNRYSTQPNEKLNEFSTIYYHQCTNKNNEKLKYLNQMFKKRNRLEFYQSGGKIEEITEPQDDDEYDNEDDDSDFVPESDETVDDSDDSDQGSEIVTSDTEKDL